MNNLHIESVRKYYIDTTAPWVIPALPQEENKNSFEPGPPVELCLYLWEDKPCQKFKVPSNELDRIDCWIHELTELAIRYTFFKIRGGSYTILIKLPNGKFQRHWLEHILTSLNHSSIIKITESNKRLIQPDEYIEMVKGIPIITLCE